ncbi:hypothetical protein [Metabacillus litoralis]|uniref:hypothetical protein n=1 Tax=Metabacillus litoralis TaxID=152268 RepID=UPI001CFDD71D|nr:hypothetical protein [Metabacillus litoralis]
MELVAFLVIIIVTSLVDIFWLDTENKRWNWLKNRSKSQKFLFFLIFVGASSTLYFLFGLKFLSL